MATAKVSSMAAYASVVILARNIAPVHGDLNHIRHGLDFKPLFETVVQLLAIMDNCPGETLSQEFEAKIRDYAKRANNIIETHFIQLLDRRGEGGCLSILAYFFTLILTWMNSRYLQKLTDEAACLVVEAQNFRGAVVVDYLDMQIKESSSSSSSVYTPGGATRKVRLYSDVAKLKDKLYAGSSQREVIPIVGMGGSGKTTIASVLYQDSRSERWFDRRAWITVSQNYDKYTLLSQILKSLNESAPETYEELGVKVHQTLKWRRYLVVIDDVWSEKLWDDINIFLPDDGKGSRILLTTRLENVVNYVVSSSDESYIHMCELMNLDSSWRLLKDSVFGMDRECPVELEEIGKSIAKDCAGLPLAIVVIAGVLSSAGNRKDLWEKIIADVKTALNLSSSNGVTKILSWSYVNLPHHLKSCFLYLACFPEDYRIKVSELVMLWAAEGFLKLSKSHMSEEEVAYEYLEDLVKRNLVTVSLRNNIGKIEHCCLHDMIRDLCVETSAKENFMILANDNSELSAKENTDPIRFSIGSERSLFHARRLLDKHFRSALYFGEVFTLDSYMQEFFVMRFRLLRVLNFENINFSDFPYQVCELFLLRYLAIRVLTSYTSMERYVIVPSSIKNLQCLQVFDVFAMPIILPLEIWEMPKLRQLICLRGIVLPDLPIGTTSSSSSSSLENLQTLETVFNFECTEQVLQMIPNIKSLSIEQFTGSHEYILENIIYLANLETLTIRRNFSSRSIMLPPSLKELTLVNCCFLWSEVGTVVGSLPNLEVMDLESDGCDGDIWC